MPIRRGAEYLASLRDGRRPWLMGQWVEDTVNLDISRFFRLRPEPVIVRPRS